MLSVHHLQLINETLLQGDLNVYDLTDGEPKLVTNKDYRRLPEFDLIDDLSERLELGARVLSETEWRKHELDQPILSEGELDRLARQLEVYDLDGSDLPGYDLRNLLTCCDEWQQLDSRLETYRVEDLSDFIRDLASSDDLREDDAA